MNVEMGKAKKPLEACFAETKQSFLGPGEDWWKTKKRMSSGGYKKLDIRKWKS